MRKYRPRIHYTEADKALMWDRWQQGESLHEITRLFDRYHHSVRCILAATGGIRPPPRRRSRLALSGSEREEISRCIVAGHSIRSIARTLGRSPSAISRELRRNGGRQQYRANRADQAAWARACRPGRFLGLHRQSLFGNPLPRKSLINAALPGDLGSGLQFLFEVVGNLGVHV